MFEALKEHRLCPARIPGRCRAGLVWAALGIPVDVIDARQARAVMRLQHNKTDANDAELLAEIARSGFCRPVSAKSASAQEGRVLLKSRSHLVRQRRDTQNTIRGLLASLGLRFPEGSGKPATRVRAALADHPELRPAIAPLLSSLSGLEAMVAELDKAIAARTTDDPACRLLMTVPGVGPVTALAYVSTIGAGRALRQVAQRRRLCRADLQALAIRRDGLCGAHLQARRRDAAQPADGGLPRPSAEGLGTTHQEADQLQEGLRGAGAPVGGDHAPHADHRRAVSAGRPSRPRIQVRGRPRRRRDGRQQRNGRNDRRKLFGSAPTEGRVLAGTMAEAIPRVWLHGGSYRQQCVSHPGKPKPKGTIMERVGRTAGENSADNRVSGGDNRSGRVDRKSGIR